jgi:hypothetical protein
VGDHVESKDAAAADIPNQCGNNFKLITNNEGKKLCVGIREFTVLDKIKKKDSKFNMKRILSAQAA